MNNNKNNWWETFFTDLILDFQRQLSADKDTSNEVDFIVRTLELLPKARVLDVPCGHGRHSIELAMRGYGVTGVDITDSCIKDTQTTAAQRQLEINLERRDMRDLPWKDEFDGAFCFWGSFGYFDDRGNLNFLDAVFRTLRPGARFLLDTHIAETLFPTLFQERSWTRVGDILVLEERHYDYLHGITNTSFTLIQNGHLEKKSSSIRLYTYRELCQMLERVGFHIDSTYGTVAGKMFKLGSPRLYLVSKKVH
jgi:2-polyprenyl-3-methyl-5-hydroxy-6-metoxy-1,4-benzoquinol methylase